MKYVLCLVLFFYEHALSQVNANIDSLSKYSYCISGVGYDTITIVGRGLARVSNPVSGTGFFLRRADSLYLVTAAHVVNGCQFRSEHKGFPRFMSVKIPGSISSITIDAGLIADTCACLPYYEYPDIMVVPVDRKWIQYVNYVTEDMFAPLYIFGDISFTGFPKPTSMPVNTIWPELPPSQMVLPAGLYTFERTYYSEIPKEDLLNYSFTSGLLSDTAGLHGYSGSPVFVLDPRSKKWKLVGISSSYSTGANTAKLPIYMVVARIDLLMNKFR